jgi:NAD+ diphosphatase
VTDFGRIPVLARSAHDRVAHRRRNADWLDKAWQNPATRVLVLSAAGTAAVEAGSLRLIGPDQVGIDGERILLGEADGVAYFAVLAFTEVSTADIDGDWLTLRQLAVNLDDLEVGLLTTAVALQAWHQRHIRCPRCGAVTEVSQAGWTRTCPEDASEHFPRTDPAVIMLVTDGRDRVVLGRGPDWGAGRMSVLAGFVEAGESAEAAVAREVAEEVGISIRDIRYVASQPHPFPGSLMLGFTAVLDGDDTLVIDHDEMAEAGWFTRDEVRRAVDWGDEANPAAPPEEAVLRGLPSAMSIARQLINNWLAES